MGLSQHGYLVLCYTLAVFVLTAFFAYACVYSYLARRQNTTVENFITARGKVSAMCWRGRAPLPLLEGGRAGEDALRPCGPAAPTCFEQQNPVSP